jgi:hypothetical protein
MRTFDHVQERRGKVEPETERRLPSGQSLAVITGLSVLSWGVVILLVAAVRAIVGVDGVDGPC